jgi:hypothetical protein
MSEPSRSPSASGTSNRVAHGSGGTRARGAHTTAGMAGTSRLPRSRAQAKFPFTFGDTTQAKALCAVCAVSQPCLEYALAARARPGRDRTRTGLGEPTRQPSRRHVEEGRRRSGHRSRSPPARGAPRNELRNPTVDEAASDGPETQASADYSVLRTTLVATLWQRSGNSTMEQWTGGQLQRRRR